MSKRRLISFDWAMKNLLRSKANFETLEGFLSELLKDNIIAKDTLDEWIYFLENDGVRS